jgi:dolichyl-phosphate-mannose-protein mannosyltransferase
MRITADANLRWWGLAVLALAGGALLRLPGLSTDLWLDELWSLQTALNADSWRDVLFRFRIDNNHHLNSLYLYVVGEQSSPVVYRLLAFVSSLAAVVTAWLIGARESRAAAGLAALLFATSFTMVFYASEARGYATVSWLTLAAWYCLERYAETPKIKWGGAFAVSCALGIMAHQTFVLFLFGAYVWYDAHLQKTRRSLRSATGSMFRLFALPAIFVGIFYVSALIGQEIGGGPPYRLATVVAQTLSAVSGGPLQGVGLWIIAAAVATVFAGAVWSARRSGDDRWVLYLATGIVIPAIIVIVRQPSTLSPRYFVVPVTVLLLASARWLARSGAHGRLAAFGVTAVVAAHVAGGVAHVTSTRASRGHYSDVVRQIVGSPGSGAVTVASIDAYGGHDFRTHLLIDYHRRHVAGGQRIQYVTSAAYPSEGVDWAILESLGEKAPLTMSDGKGHDFSLCGTYPSGDLSGITWFLYRDASARADRHGGQTCASSLDP